MVKSLINPVLTLDYIIYEDENKIFDLVFHVKGQRSVLFP